MNRIEFFNLKQSTVKGIKSVVNELMESIELVVRSKMSVICCVPSDSRCVES